MRPRMKERINMIPLTKKARETLSVLQLSSFIGGGVGHSEAAASPKTRIIFWPQPSPPPLKFSVPKVSLAPHKIGLTSYFVL